MTAKYAKDTGKFEEAVRSDFQKNRIPFLAKVVPSFASVVSCHVIWHLASTARALLQTYEHEVIEPNRLPPGIYRVQLLSMSSVIRMFAEVDCALQWARDAADAASDGSRSARTAGVTIGSLVNKQR